MKGYEQISIQNRGVYVVYKGEHYAIRNANTGHTVRMAKADIVKKFHLHADALDRYVGAGFKKRHCNANEDIVLVKRSKNDVESISFFITSAVAIVCGVALILGVVLGYIDAHSLRPYVVPMACAAFTAMFLSVEVVEYIADEFDFVLGIKREEA